MNGTHVAYNVDISQHSIEEVFKSAGVPKASELRLNETKASVTSLGPRAPS